MTFDHDVVARVAQKIAGHAPSQGQSPDYSLVQPGAAVGAGSLFMKMSSEAVLVFDQYGWILKANEPAELLFASTLQGEQIGRYFCTLNSDPAEGDSSSVLCDSGLHTVAFQQEKPGGKIFPSHSPHAKLMWDSSLSLPFRPDCKIYEMGITTAKGEVHKVLVRCGAIIAARPLFGLICYLDEPANEAQRVQDLLIHNLRRTQHRLSGALSIVTETLDVSDLSGLFETLLTEMAHTVEADAALLYIADNDGFYLQETSCYKQEKQPPLYLRPESLPEQGVLRSACTQRFHVMDLEPKSARGHSSDERLLVNQDSQEELWVQPQRLTPFTSYMTVPIFYDSEPIALIHLGWQERHSIAEEDCKLLDTVSHYLSLRFDGLMLELHRQRAQHYQDVLNNIREDLLHESVTSGDELRETMYAASLEVAAALNASLFELCVTDDAYLYLEDSEGELIDLACSAERYKERYEEIPLFDVLDDSDLKPDDLTSADKRPGGSPMTRNTAEAASLKPLAAVVPAHQAESSSTDEPAHQAEPSSTDEPALSHVILSALKEERGAQRIILLNLGEIASEPCVLVLARGRYAEPLNEFEMQFLEDVVEDMTALLTGESERSTTEYIAQALQTGMQNELQKVKGLSAESCYSSATAFASVGGDFYDLIALPGHKACLIMGDVSGKGVEAASVSAAVKTSLAAYSWMDMPPSKMVTHLNQFLLGFSRIETFVTLFVGIIDIEKRLLTYCSAGHPPVALVHSDCGELEFLNEQSGMVGAFESMRYRDGQAELKAGDVLVLYTDGTTEARNSEGLFFGEEGVRDTVLQHLTEQGFSALPQRLLATLDEFTDLKLKDDVAIIAVRFDGLESS